MKFGFWTQVFQIGNVAVIYNPQMTKAIGYHAQRWNTNSLTRSTDLQYANTAIVSKETNPMSEHKAAP